MDILILGGTTFLGPHLVESALKQGHKVTLFHRGIQNPSLFPELKHLIGDRNSNLQALEGRKWDAVIDTSGNAPISVEKSAQILSKFAPHYTFISSISAYRDHLQDNIDENYPVASDDTYGGLKAQAEKIVQKYFPKKALIIRPGLIVGPGDPTDRFSYWPLRIAQGGDVIAPADPNYLVQWIDVHDLASWIITMIDKGNAGVFNAVGPKSPCTFETLLEECQKFSPTQTTIHWLDEKFLIDEKVQDWSDLPLWLSHSRNMPGFLKANSQKAIQAGLTFRPVRETIEALLNWHRAELKTGLKPEREKELLNKWKSNIIRT